MENLLRVPPDPKRCRENLPLLQEVRSCPPTPQRFPSPLSLRRKATVTPVKPCSKPDTSERGILREMVHNKEEVQALVGMDDCSNNAMSNSPATVEGKSVDLFWFFKPCTYL
uniref:Uncharacterized protein n=1 Tax=Anthurium amnicola TaxID=1678845 RepID=A0A1D1XIA7_9ARAE